MDEEEEEAIDRWRYDREEARWYGGELRAREEVAFVTPPPAREVPIPTALLPADGREEDDPRISSIRRLIAHAASRAEIRLILIEAACELVSSPDRTMSLMALGSKLSRGSISWMRSNRVSLGRLLDCFRHDFHIVRVGGCAWATYLHTSVSNSYCFALKKEAADVPTGGGAEGSTEDGISGTDAQQLIDGTSAPVVAAGSSG
eukprot:TRINITY_DN61009_c0_g1_i1.p1 TRINITY_DN61009_c0_g1~~TRINITY_DN61009_c0_g1_i1.p1  ORF type:complete len:203 (-),score=27.14 TRINITY_DN61009_c0_g1_i1:218-826(-)